MHDQAPPVQDSRKSKVSISMVTASRAREKERANVSVEVNNPEFVIEKIVRALAEKFPPESVLTIQTGSVRDSSADGSSVERRVRRGSADSSSARTSSLELGPALRNTRLAQHPSDLANLIQSRHGYHTPCTCHIPPNLKRQSPIKGKQPSTSLRSTVAGSTPLNHLQIAQPTDTRQQFAESIYYSSYPNGHTRTRSSQPRSCSCKGGPLSCQCSGMTTPQTRPGSIRGTTNVYSTSHAPGCTCQCAAHATQSTRPTPSVHTVSYTSSSDLSGKPATTTTTAFNNSRPQCSTLDHVQPPPRQMRSMNQPGSSQWPTASRWTKSSAQMLESPLVHNPIAQASRDGSDERLDCIDPFSQHTSPNVEPFSQHTSQNADPFSQHTSPNVEPFSAQNVDPFSQHTSPNVEAFPHNTSPGSSSRPENRSRWRSVVQKTSDERPTPNDSRASTDRQNGSDYKIGAKQNFVTYVEVPVYEERVVEVPVSQIVDVAREVKETVIETRETLEEYPEIEWREVQREVEVEHWVEREVKVPQVVQRPVEKIVHHHVVTKTTTENVLQLNELRERPRAVTIEQNIAVPRVSDFEKATIVAETVQTSVAIEEDRCVEIDACDYEPVLITTEIPIPKPVPMSAILGQTRLQHRTIDVSVPHWNSMVQTMNSNVPAGYQHLLPYQHNSQGSVPLLPSNETLEVIEPKLDDWKPSHVAGQRHVRVESGFEESVLNDLIRDIAGARRKEVHAALETKLIQSEAEHRHQMTIRQEETQLANQNARRALEEQAAQRGATIRFERQPERSESSQSSITAGGRISSHSFRPPLPGHFNRLATTTTTQ